MHTHTPTQAHKHLRDTRTATRSPYRDPQPKRHTTHTHTQTHTRRVLEVVLGVHTGTEVRFKTRP